MLPNKVHHSEGPMALNIAALQPALLILTQYSLFLTLEHYRDAFSFPSTAQVRDMHRKCLRKVLKFSNDLAAVESEVEQRCWLLNDRFLPRKVQHF